MMEMDLFDKAGIRGMKYEDINNLGNFPKFVSDIIKAENHFFGYKSNNLKSLEKCVKKFLNETKKKLNEISKNKNIIGVEIASAEICSVSHTKDNINFFETKIGYYVYDKESFLKPRETNILKVKYLRREHDWIML